VIDADLVARARQGDSAAFGELADRHRTAVYRAALAALGSHAEAEDAAQDAFLIAYRRLGSFRGEASFKTWLLTIAWHQAINRRRTLTRLLRRMVGNPVAQGSSYHVARRFSRAADEDPLASVAAAGLSPEAAAAHEQLQRAARDAINALSPKLRDALVLVQSDQYSYEEIAAILAAPVGTVKWRISEARKQVRRQLQERGFRE